MSNVVPADFRTIIQNLQLIPNKYYENFIHIAIDRKHSKELKHQAIHDWVLLGWLQKSEWNWERK